MGVHCCCRFRSRPPPPSCSSSVAAAGRAPPLDAHRQRQHRRRGQGPVCGGEGDAEAVPGEGLEAAAVPRGGVGVARRRRGRERGRRPAERPLLLAATPGGVAAPLPLLPPPLPLPRRCLPQEDGPGQHPARPGVGGGLEEDLRGVEGGSRRQGGRGRGRRGEEGVAATVFSSSLSSSLFALRLPESERGQGLEHAGDDGVLPQGPL